LLSSAACGHLCRQSRGPIVADSVPILQASGPGGWSLGGLDWIGVIAGLELLVGLAVCKCAPKRSTLGESTDFLGGHPPPQTLPINRGKASLKSAFRPSWTWVSSQAIPYFRKGRGPTWGTPWADLLERSREADAVSGFTSPYFLPDGLHPDQDTCPDPGCPDTARMPGYPDTRISGYLDTARIPGLIFSARMPGYSLKFYHGRK
jgi:hypothetical protein